MSNSANFPVSNYNLLKEQLLTWCSAFNNCSFLDNHLYKSKWSQAECLVAVGIHKSISCHAGNALQQLQNFIDNNRGHWLFGHLSYDLKNEIEELRSNHPNHVLFSDLFFYIPKIVIRLNKDQITIDSLNGDPQIIFNQINQLNPTEKHFNKIINVSARLNRQQYIQIIDQLKRHIKRGDCYEINYCQEFFAENVTLNPLASFKKLCQISPNPFSCYYKIDNKYLLCASPERYIMKKNNIILSQPIKGTAPRILNNKENDIAQSNYLRNSQKEQSENVMIVDLVRNDFSKICEAGTVKVDELFGIYPYPQVHQMISTISGQLKEDTSFSEIIRATFPMGSMTGAPKKRVMELIEQYEYSKRGLFSGSMGYISPNGDFDFNVVIRSLFYNASTQYLSYQVGSGITANCNPEQEYEECMLKAKAICEVLYGSTILA